MPEKDTSRVEANEQIKSVSLNVMSVIYQLVRSIVDSVLKIPYKPVNMFMGLSMPSQYCQAVMK